MFQLPNEKYVYLFTEPVSMRIGDKKIEEICQTKMNINPRVGGIFIFFNKKQDQLKLFFFDATGSQEFVKILPQGGFLLPTSKNGEAFLKLEKSKLNLIFKTNIF